MTSRIKIGILLIAILALAGCATGHLYTGPEQPIQELALLSVNRDGEGGVMSKWIVRVREVDGISAPRGGIASTKFYVPPGEHRLLIETDTKWMPAPGRIDKMQPVQNLKEFDTLQTLTVT